MSAPNILWIGLLAISIRLGAASCPKNCATTSNCECNGKKGSFKIILDEDVDKIIDFHCNESGGGFEIEDLSGVGTVSYQIDYVVIQNCEFPQETILNVVKIFGESYLKQLDLINVKNLTQNQVEGLQTLQHLSLEKINLLESDILKLFSSPTLLPESNTIIESNDRITLKSLTIENCNLINLSAGLFKEFPSVKRLEIRINPLTEINKDAFKGLASLEILHVIGNKRLNQISAKALSNMPRLKNISFENNHLETLSSALFTGLNDLNEVLLGFNFLTQLPLNLLKGLRELKVFIVKNNKLREIPPDFFKDQENIQCLDFSFNSIENISPEVFRDLKTLEKLYLDHNHLHEFSKTVLVPASMSKSDAESAFHGLSSLQVLSLNNNNISRIYQDWRTKLLHLKQLDLSNNRFTALTAADLDFNGRQLEINFRNNTITTIELLREDSRIPKLDLKNNILKCDCKMHMFSRFLQRNGNQSNLICATPENLRQRLIYTISSEEFLCPSSECHPSCECNDTPGASTEMKLECEDIPFLGDLNQFIIKNNSTLRLKRRPSSLVDLPSSITILNLSNLSLTTLPSFPESISFRALDLSNNYLFDVPVELLTPKGPKLWLSGNKFVCDCDHMESIELLNRFKYNVEDYDSVFCANTNETIEKATELCSERNDRIFGITLGVVGFVCFVIVIVITVCRHKLAVLTLGKCSCLGQEESLDRNKTYDAFISYAHHDIDFVTGTLVPELESGSEPYKLCLHYRDWNAGDWIPEQILRSVQNSRRTMVILSEKSLGSDWVLQEFRMAHENAKRDRVARVIVVLLDDVTKDERLDRELQAYLTSSTYLMWGEEWFWKKMRDALPQRRWRRTRVHKRSIWYFKC